MENTSPIFLNIKYWFYLLLLDFFFIIIYINYRVYPTHEIYYFHSRGCSLLNMVHESYHPPGLVLSLILSNMQSESNEKKPKCVLPIPTTYKSKLSRNPCTFFNFCLFPAIIIHCNRNSSLLLWMFYLFAYYILENTKSPIFIILIFFSWYKYSTCIVSKIQNFSLMFLSFPKFNTNNPLFTIHTYVYIKTSITWYQSHARCKGHCTQPYLCICKIVVS